MTKVKQNLEKKMYHLYAKSNLTDQYRLLYTSKNFRWLTKMMWACEDAYILMEDDGAIFKGMDSRLKD